MLIYERDKTPGKFTVTYIDPPEGWRYGFPKILPRNIREEDLEEWLLSKNYPQRLIGLALKYSRYWEK